MEPVVKFSRQGAMGLVVLEDRQYKNTFSPALVAQLQSTFADIARMSDLKVVLVHGYDNYFCCGGTKEELISLYEGVNHRDGHSGLSLDSLHFYDLFLRCPVPVIAAMQGHAIGGGLALGLFADVVVMGEECIYNAVFMKYGFTPGMGSTYIVPKKMGEALGAEMLFTARNYYGQELKNRGAQTVIVKKSQVIEQAMSIAADFIEKPHLSLRLLKDHLTRHARVELVEATARERSMHEQTFAQPEVRGRINGLFGV